MFFESINPTSFSSKNTFLQKSKSAYLDAKIVARKEGLTPLAKSKIAELEKLGAYYKSLHFEAEARLDNIKSEKEFGKLKEPGTLETFPGISGLLKMAKIFFKGCLLKFNSAITQGDSFGAFPERFKEADNTENKPARYYKY